MQYLKKLAGLAFLMCWSLSTVMAQDMAGKELVKNNDVTSLVESGIGLLFGASDIEGSVQKVVVVTDAPNKLSVKVSLTGFTSNWLKGCLLDVNKTRIDDIESASIQITEGLTEIEMLFKLKETPQNQVNRSLFLKLLVTKKEADPTGMVFAYNLDKEWKASGLSVDEVPTYAFIQEGAVVDIQPVPVGSAAQLKDAQPNLMPLPGRISKVKINEAIYKDKIERRPMMLRPVMLQQSGATPQKQTPTKQLRPDVTLQTRTVKTDKTSDEKTSFTPVAQLNPALMKPLQLTKEQVDKGAKGPGNSAISLWDEIRSDVNFDFGENGITNISTDVFPDQNEQSGYYYFFPASYNLKWDRDESYQLRILYGSASDNQSAQVNMFVQLTPAVGTKEKSMVETLVKEYASKNKLPFEKLLAVPLAGVPQVDLSAHLSSLYQVPSDKVVTSVSGLFDPVEVAWPMDSRKADDFMVGLKEVDLNGGLILQPQGEMPEVNVPVRISLDDEKVLGRIELNPASWRSQKWKNEMPFPVRLKYIHALFLNKDEQGATVPFIYSWDLKSTEIPVLAEANLNTSTVPRLVDTKAERIWIDYAVPECNDCSDKVLNELMGGTTRAREQRIEVVSYVKERTGALVIEVQLRSALADTKGQQIIELPPLKINEDGESYYLGPLFVPQDKKPEYEYRIKLVTDEDVLQSDWIYSTELSLYLNKKLVEEALGTFPGE